MTKAQNTKTENTTDTDRRSKLYDVAEAHDLNDQKADELVHLFMERFPNNRIGSASEPYGYVDEWVTRLKRGTEMVHADAETADELRSLR